MDYLDGMLKKNESIIFNDVIDTPQLRYIIITLAIIPVLLMFYDFIIALFAFGAWLSIYYYMSQRGTVITNNRLLKVSGIFEFSFEEMRLSQIESMKTGWGQIVVHGSGNNKITLLYDYKKSDIKSKLDDAIDICLRQK
jgi:hypothetical protein